MRVCAIVIARESQHNCTNHLVVSIRAIRFIRGIAASTDWLARLPDQDRLPVTFARNASIPGMAETQRENLDRNSGSSEPGASMQACLRVQAFRGVMHTRGEVERLATNDSSGASYHDTA